MHPRELIWRDARIGLEAVLVVDDTTLGPAVGGTRTKIYGSLEHARSDARRLARAMTLKCALAGLDAGGCKLVVRRPPEAHRQAVFAELGRRIDALGGEIHTAGDFGTTAVDLENMANETEWVHLDGSALAASTARGLVRCVQTWAARGALDIAKLSVAVQGCGAIGAAVATALVQVGARVTVADLDPAKAARVVGARVVDPDDVLTEAVDVLAPCAIGGVIDTAGVANLRARAIIGAANNILSDAGAAQALHERGVLFVPDIVASAGAVVDGVGAVIMGLDDRSELIDRLGVVAANIIDRAKHDGITTVAAAELIAATRLGRMLRLFY
jgi:leucine dehydrogenase